LRAYASHVYEKPGAKQEIITELSYFISKGKNKPKSFLLLPFCCLQKTLHDSLNHF
jgi:hypothetical protein